MTEAEKKRLQEIAGILRSLAERCQATASGIEQFPATWESQVRILWTEVLIHKRQVAELAAGGRGPRHEDARRESEADDADVDAD